VRSRRNLIAAARESRRRLRLRCLIEGTFSWFGRNRRLAENFENLAETVATVVTVASIQACSQAACQSVGCNARIIEVRKGAATRPSSAPLVNGEVAPEAVTLPVVNKPATLAEELSL
jgi:hypothetical protein